MADKLQGQDFALSAVSGNIHINSLYAAKSTLQCNHGDIDINNCHGATVICTTEGDIKLSELVIVWGLINSNSLPGTQLFPERCHYVVNLKCRNVLDMVFKNICLLHQIPVKFSVISLHSTASSQSNLNPFMRDFQQKQQ